MYCWLKRFLTHSTVHELIARKCRLRCLHSFLKEQGDRFISAVLCVQKCASLSLSPPLAVLKHLIRTLCYSRPLHVIFNFVKSAGLTLVCRKHELVRWVQKCMLLASMATATYGAVSLVVTTGYCDYWISEGTGTCIIIIIVMPPS
jgi:hypothetical protein